ncbi:MAG: hypothetical protein ACXWW7_16165 [Nocardioides sp.]
MSIDDLLTQELATVARGVEPPPAPVDDLVARGRDAGRRSRWYARGAVAAAAVLVAGTVAVGLPDHGDERPAPSERPTGPVGLGYRVGESPQVPTQIGQDIWVDGRLLPDPYDPFQTQGGGAVARNAVDTQWRVLTQPGMPMLPDTMSFFPVPAPDGDTVAWIDRADMRRPELVLWTFADGEQSGESRLALPVDSRAILLGVDGDGNVYYEPITGEDPNSDRPPLRVWNPATGADSAVTRHGKRVSGPTVIPQGLQFSDDEGTWAGAPGTDGVLDEAVQLPQLIRPPRLSPGLTRVAWATDKKGGEVDAEALPPDSRAFVTVQEVGDRGSRRQVPLPANVDFAGFQWEDDGHLLLSIYDTELGTKQSLLRCDLEGACEYAVPPEE